MRQARIPVRLVGLWVRAGSPHSRAELLRRRSLVQAEAQEEPGEISARIDPRPLRVDERLYEIRESAYTHACFPDASRVEIRL